MKSNGKMLTFIKKNAIYLVLALCVLAVGLSVTFMLINKEEPALKEDIPLVDDSTDVDNETVPDGPVIEPEKPDVKPVEKPVQFIMPVENATSIEKYSETMVFNKTMGHFSAHKATDFFAPEGTNVLAVYDGTVSKVEKTMLEGVTVTIDHGKGLFTIYNSLLDSDNVFVGKEVKTGDIIGEVSLSNRTEYKDGAHLHFEVMEDGKLIDPVKYLSFGEK